MTYSDAKIYVARAMGASGNSTQLSAAGDAIKAAIQEWNLRRDWRFLLMDTGDGFAVAACSNTSGTVTTTTTNGFAGVNVDMTFTVTDGAPAGTYTVSAVNSTTSITVTGGGGDFTTESITFAGDIPLREGVDTYNLPSPFKRPYTARLLTNEATLDWKDQREIDLMFRNQDAQRVPFYYNLFTSSTFTQTRQNGKIRVFPEPSTTDTLRVRYYRPIAEPASDAEQLDLPDRYVYALLETARWQYLKNHDAELERLNLTAAKAEQLFVKCAQDDEGETDDRNIAMVSQMEYARIISDDPLDWP